jgi:hypothetical protein
MSKSNKALLYNFLSFLVIYTVINSAIRYFLINITGLWIPFSSAILTTFLAPKFQAIKTKDGEKLFVKYFFWSDIKEIK